MTNLLIRSRSLIPRVHDRFSYEEIQQGAILVDDGVIAEIGTFADLTRRFPEAPVVGTGNEVVLPGFVNAHHHVGLTPVQLGSPDMPLELWFVTRMVMRSVDLYLDTLYSAFEMIASGVTTVQHIQSVLPGSLDEVEAKCRDVLRAYDDVGMRASYSYSVRDQNRLVYRADEEFVASLPRDLQGPVQRWFDRIKVGLPEAIELTDRLRRHAASKSRIAIQLAPANLHWCSDHALATLAETSRTEGLPMHMHVLETQYQKAYAERRGGCSAIAYLDRFGMLGPKLTIGHGVWLTQADVERLAETGTCICHNCSSNFRLRSGIAALNHFEAKGIATAIGIDEAGLNDDRDMLQEMRLVLRAHRVPGLERDEVPTTPQVLRMATAGGAMTTPFARMIGSLEPGKAADLIMIDWQDVAYPYLDPETSTLDAIVQRAKSHAVGRVICDGEIIYEQGRFKRVDRAEVLRAIHDDMARALSDDEVERRGLAKALLPHVQAFYADWVDASQHEPFYRMNGRR
ncbi:MAG: amidohydrolase family protein [Hyphomicrobiaceae bacterium]